MARVREQVMNAKTKTMLDLDNPTLDWVQMSTSLGVPATRAATAEEFHREFEAALAAKGPRLIECQVAIAKEMVALTEYIHKMR
jgi:acetolactate synthase-1/2/3 large subunit